MERRGGAVGTPEGGVRSWCGRDDGCHSPGGGLFVALILPDFVALLDQGLRLLELLRVDQISDVTRQFAEEKDCLDFFHCRWLQGGDVVPHDRGPVVAATQVIQPFA